jgi:CofH/MqnC C-terminal region
MKLKNKVSFYPFYCSLILLVTTLRAVKLLTGLIRLQNFFRAHRLVYRNIQDAISEARFEPKLRNQRYEWRELPAMIEEQVIDY